MVCNCPFCPLISANIQVCDVKIKLPKKGSFSSTDVVLDDTIHPAYKIEIVNIILWVKNTIKVPIGMSNTIDRPDMYCNVFRDRTNLFTFCFHAKK
jgi:hypothetical protein